MTPLLSPHDSVALLIGDDTVLQIHKVEAFGQQTDLHPSPDHLVTVLLWLSVGKKDASMFESPRGDSIQCRTGKHDVFETERITCRPIV